MEARKTSVRRFLRGGGEGNARLTGMTGLVLLVLLAVEGVTVLDICPRARGRRSCSCGCSSRRGSSPPRSSSSAPVSRSLQSAGRGIVLGLHQASFFVWLGAFGVHVLAYALRVPGLVAADFGRAPAPRERPCPSGVVALRSSSA